MSRRTLAFASREKASLEREVYSVACFLSLFWVLLGAGMQPLHAEESKELLGNYLYVEKIDNIRKGPSIKSEILRKTVLCERLEYISKKGSWYQVIADKSHSEAWIHESGVYTENQKRQRGLGNVDLQKVTKELPYGPWVAKSVTESHLYDSPDLESKKICSVPQGTEFVVLEEKPRKGLSTDWLKVEYLGKTGWFMGWLTDKVHDTSALPPPERVDVKSTKGKIVVVATYGTRARLSPIPDSPPENQEILRIPQGTKLEVLDEHANKYNHDLEDIPERIRAALPKSITWYKVVYRGKSGWICENDLEK